MMRINRLVLKDFRCFQDAELIFDQPITFLIGANRTGKSSCGDGLEFALSGRCVRGTDAGGKNAKTLVRDFGKPTCAARLAVGLTLDGKEYTRSVSANGNGQLSGPLPPMNPGVVRILCNGTSFLDPKVTSEAEGQKILLDVLDVKVPIDGDLLTLAQIDLRYQHAYEERTIAKRLLNAIVIPALPEGELPPDDLAEQIEVLRKAERELYAQQQATTARDRGRAAELSRQLALAREKVVKVQTGIGARDYPKDLANQIAALAKAIEASPVDAKALDVQRAFIAEVAGKLKPLDTAAKAIQGHEPQRGCLLDPAIPCKTPGAAFAAHTRKILAQIAGLLEQQDKAKGALAELATADELRLKQAAQLADLKVMREQQVRDGKMLTEAQAAVTKLEQDLTTCDSQPDGSAVELEAIATLEERIAAGDQMLIEAHRIKAQLAERQKRTQERQAAARRVDELERLCDLLGPSGARLKALETALGAFEGSINEALVMFGYELHFALDPWAVLVNGFPATLLSETEQIRVGIALQMALADVTGLGWVVIDRVDHFDEASREVFQQLVSAWTGQVIAMATKSEKDMDKLERELRADPVEGVTFYRLRRDVKNFGPTTVERCGAAVAV
jgi:DNA repair exonuclease SbcCD ATPase subunit